MRYAEWASNCKHRDGYMVDGARQYEPLDWTEDQWRAAVHNPVGSTAVQLDARLQFDADTKTIGMIMQISIDDLHFRQVDSESSAAVTLAIVDKLSDAQFKMRRALRDVPFPEGVAREVGVVDLRHTWELTPGATTVRLIARDRFTGRYGSLDVPVKDTALPAVTQPWRSRAVRHDRAPEFDCFKLFGVERSAGAYTRHQ